MRKLAILTITCLTAISGFAQYGISELKHPKDRFWGSAWGWTFIISVIVFLVVALYSLIEQRANRHHE